MTDDENPTKTGKKADISENSLITQLLLIPSVPCESTNNSTEIKRPRLMNEQEARWIAGGKKMRVVR